MKEKIAALATEKLHPKAVSLHTLSSLEIVKLMNQEDERVPSAVRKQLPHIATAVEGIVSSLSSGGRLFYVGAGTSGRLGILDASECPPTFGVSPNLVQGIIAGGRKAVFVSVEGAEDSQTQGKAALLRKKLTSRDAVVGVSASGRTPFVLGALKHAGKVGAFTVGVTCHGKGRLLKHCEVGIAVEVGPEIIAGSTRLKAGTAQKMVLNMLSTAAMIRLGRVHSHYMVDLLPRSEKLVERQKRIVMALAGVSTKEAERLLKKAGGDVRRAVTLASGRAAGLDRGTWRPGVRKDSRG